jgi:hypothetical protein
MSNPPPSQAYLDPFNAKTADYLAELRLERWLEEEFGETNEPS